MTDCLHPTLTLLVAGGGLALAGAACAMAADTPLPAVTFPGHGGIGADFNVDPQPATAWRTTRATTNVWDRCYLAALAIRFAVAIGGIEMVGMI